jgi:DNA topoisomerase-1
MSLQPITIDNQSGYVVYLNDAWESVSADRASLAKVLFDDGRSTFYRVSQRRDLGGAGSGHHGHAGRPGQQGGSATAHFRPATAEQRKALKLPPGWTDVRINPDPNAALQAVGKDSKGRQTYRYSVEHSGEAAAEKFARLQEFNKALPNLREQVAADLSSDDPEVREAATLIRLIDRTSFRVGSNRDTLAEKKAFGATTLEARHVKIDGDDIRFRFIGKKGVPISKRVEDGPLARALEARMPARGPIFGAGADGRVRGYIGQHAPGFTPKDFRTRRGTTEALAILKRMPVPKGAAALRKARREVGKRVAKALGNTPAVALGSYIDPAVFGRWEAR